SDVCSSDLGTASNVLAPVDATVPVNGRETVTTGVNPRQVRHHQGRTTMSPLSTLLAIFVEPAKAMQAVREKSMFWLPLLLLLLGTAAVQVWYYQIVDIAWLQDYMLSAGGATSPDPQALEAAKGFMTRGVLLGSTIAGVFIVVPIILLIGAVYYLLAAKVIGSDIGFGKWFAFNVWASVPTLLLIPAGIVQILMSSKGQIAPAALNPLSQTQLMS